MISRKRIHWILGVYLIILVLSIPILYLLPKEKFADNSLVNKKTMEQVQQANLDFYNTASAGGLGQTDGVIKQGKGDLKFDGRQLKIDLAGGNFNLMIMVERKTTNDGMIEFVNYSTRSIMEGIDITEEIKRPEISIVGMTMIIRPEPVAVAHAKFKKDFVAAQLQREGVEHDVRGSVIGSQILYLEIPKDVQIKATSLAIQYVDEK